MTVKLKESKILNNFKGFLINIKLLLLFITFQFSKIKFKLANYHILDKEKHVRKRGLNEGSELEK